MLCFERVKLNGCFKPTIGLLDLGSPVILKCTLLTTKSHSVSSAWILPVHTPTKSPGLDLTEVNSFAKRSGVGLAFWESYVLTSADSLSLKFQVGG